jgi:sugar phosphate permease
MADHVPTRTERLRNGWSAGALAAMSGGEAFLVSTLVFRIACITIGVAAFLISILTLLKARDMPKATPPDAEP